MSKGKSSNTNKKNNTTQKAKKEKTINQELIEEEASYTFLRIIIALILVAIIVVLAVKSCKKDEKESENKNKKVTTTQKKVEVTTTTPHVYYDVTYPVSDTNSEVETSVLQTAISAAETVEETVDDTAPKIYGVSNNGVYDIVNITAEDDKTKEEDLVALLDGQPYNLGDEYAKNGKHKVTIIDEANNESEVTFVIAKIITTKGEYEEALRDEQIEYIAFANDINDDIEVTRDVKITSVSGVILTFGITVNENVLATLENVNVKHSNGKKILLKGDLKIDSSEVEFDSNSVVIENDESTLEVIDSNINLSEVHSNDPVAIVIAGGVKNTNVTLERSNISLGDNTSKGIVYEDENDNSNLSIVNSTITGSDDENPSIGISLSNQQNSNIEISSSEIAGFDPSINLGENVTNCNVTISDSELSGDPIVASNDESNKIINDSDSELQLLMVSEPEKEIEMLSVKEVIKKSNSLDDIKELDNVENSNTDIILEDEKEDNKEELVETKEKNEEIKEQEEIDSRE